MVNGAKERRGFLRIPFHTTMEMKADRFMLCSESDINVSMSGLSLSFSGAVPPAGSSCRMSLILQPLGERISIEATGTIVRSEPGSLALEFTELDPDSFYHLRQLILNNTEDPEKAELEFDAHRGLRPRTFG